MKLSLGHLRWFDRSMPLFPTLAIVLSFHLAAFGQSPEPSEKVRLAEDQRIEAIRKATQSTIGVFGTDGQGGGSGVIISTDGYALTNFHVTDPFGDRMRCGMSNGEMVEAVIVGIDPTGDLALIKLEGRADFPAATLADSDHVKSGDWCFAAGNPFVLATNLQPTVTWGIVSGVHRYQYPSGTILEYTDCIQTDAAINPGNSGGPLYDIHGDLIGINGRCSFEKRGRVNVGVGYAISINQAKLFLGHLKSGRVVDHATLGLTVGTDQSRVLVSNILDQSDAYRRGLRYDDEILQLAGRDITSVNQLKNVLGIFPSYSRLPIRYRRDGTILESWIRVSSLHTLEELEEILTGKPVEPTPRRKPEPDDEPKDDSKNAKKDDEGKATPDPLADMLEKRRGFANYYFNRKELERVVAPAKGWGYAEPMNAQVWSWQGTLPGETTTWNVASKATGIETQFGDEKKLLDPKLGWTETIKNRSFHALGLALRLWQQWPTLGPRNLGETVYIGSVYIPNHEELVDVTQVTANEVEAFFYTDAINGDIRRIELEIDSGLDRFELGLDEYQTKDGQRFPIRLTAGYGPDPQWTLKVETLQLTSTPGGDL
jgi:serine protease Do